METEVWKVIPNTNCRYEASNTGKIRSTRKELTQFISSNYKCVTLHIDTGVQKKMLVHRLVAETFIEPANTNLQVNHIDGNKLNNNVSNLEWCTPKDNQRHRIYILKKDCKGKNNPMYGRRGYSSPKFKDYILQINSCGAIVGRYESTIEASRAIHGITKYNLGAGKISMCLRAIKGRTTYHGFSWVYENDYYDHHKGIKNLVNSGKLLPSKVEDNPEPNSSFITSGGATTIEKRSDANLVE